MTTAILDGDILAYRAACVGEKDDDFGEPGEKIYSLPSAIEAADMIIRDWTSRARAQVPVVAFSCEGKNFRYQVYPKYKHNRKGEKPLLYWPVVKHIEKNYRIIRKPLLEADDVIGILCSTDPTKYVGVSVDKDLKTIPGRIFNPDKDPIPKRISEAIADRYWMTQTLIGDSVDGYPGCPKVGPVKAEALLGDMTRIEKIWPVVVETFESKGLTENDAIQMARVARILRHTDFDRETREIILWHPTIPTRISTSVTASATPGSDPSTATGSTPAKSPEPRQRRRTSPASPTQRSDASPARRGKRRSVTNVKGV